MATRGKERQQEGVELGPGKVGTIGCERKGNGGATCSGEGLRGSMLVGCKRRGEREERKRSREWNGGGRQASGGDWRKGKEKDGESKRERSMTERPLGDT